MPAAQIVKKLQFMANNMSFLNALSGNRISVNANFSFFIVCQLFCKAAFNTISFPSSLSRTQDVYLFLFHNRNGESTSKQEVDTRETLSLLYQAGTKKRENIRF